MCNDSQHPIFENDFLSFTIRSFPTSHSTLLTDLNRIKYRLTALEKLTEHVILYTQLDTYSKLNTKCKCVKNREKGK